MLKTIRLTVAGVLASALFATANAGVIRDDKSDTDWEIILTPYLWGVSMKGDSGPGGTIPVDASLGDILDALNLALSLHTEFHRGRWAFVIDPTYLDLELDLDIPTPGNKPNVRVKTWLVEAWGAYKVTNNVEFLAGARYQDQDIKIKSGLDAYQPPLPGLLPDSIDAGEKWVDYFAGLRLNYPLGEKWIFTGRGDIAFAGDSDSAYNVQVFFNRRFGKTMALDLGYRYFVNDFDNGKPGLDNYVWDVKLSGPVIGYTWAF